MDFHLWSSQLFVNSSLRAGSFPLQAQGPTLFRATGIDHLLISFERHWRCCCSLCLIRVSRHLGLNSVKVETTFSIILQGHYAELCFAVQYCSIRLEAKYSCDANQ